jgi:uncharacterized protein
VKTVEEYIALIPDNRQRIVERIRLLIMENVPGIKEKLSFKIPFYHYFGMFLYLNNTKEGIAVGFCRGKDLTTEFPQLELKGRAIVATLLIKNEKEIVTKNLREIVVAAAIWNEEAKRLKLPMVKKKK